jgi:NAD(P)-dependent dehydrogenase (short-subunit alcohol dehydrogenase family)
MSVALVTGAAAGIGQTVADHLESIGWVVARNDLPGRSVDGYAAPADVADPVAVAGMVDRVAADLGPIGLLVNNAGVTTMASIDAMSPASFWRIIDVNLTSCFFCTQACVPMMRELGRGRVISISSEWGRNGRARATAYSASKAGIISLTKSLGRTLGEYGITVNAIAPGVIETASLEDEAADLGLSLDDLRQKRIEGIPLGRLGTTADVAALVEYIASDAAASLTGQVLSVNGGTTMTWA